MFPGNPYLMVGVRGELIVNAEHRDEWLATFEGEHHYLGGNEFYGLVDAYSIAMGVSDGARFESKPEPHHQWQLHEATGNWADPGPLRLRGWMQLGLYGTRDGGGGYGEENHDSPPTFAALRAIWDSLQRVGHMTLGGVDVVAPLWLVGNGFWLKVDMGQGVLDEYAAPEELLVEIGVRESGDEQIRASIVNSLDRYPNTSSVALLAGTKSRRDMREEVETLICDPDETAGVIALRMAPATWSIDTASWIADVATIACHQAGLRGSANISVRRWQDNYN